MAFIHLYIQNIGDTEGEALHACTVFLPLLLSLPAGKDPDHGSSFLCSLLVPGHSMSNARNKGRKDKRVKTIEYLQKSLRHLVEKWES